MSRVFLSDLHLQSEQEPKYQAFRRVLQEAQENKEAVYILGDLVEVWIGDDDDAIFARTLIQDLKDCAAETPVFVMHGNRDFLYRESFCEQTNAMLLPDPYVLIAEDLPEPVLLAHGDAYCTSDTAYMQARELFRSQEWQEQFLASSLDERRTVARALREHSKKANQLKAANITDVVESEIERDLQNQNCRLMIHGHTHRPGIHALEHGARYVLGDWTDCGWVLRQRDDTFQLERFAIAS